MKYLLCILGLVFIVRQSLGIEQTTALRRALLAGYEKDAKPDGKVETKVGLRVTTMDLCAHRQALTSTVWLEMMWTDRRLVWDPQEFGGMDTIRINAKNLWIPDITTYNAMSEMKPMMNGVEELSNAVVMSSGLVIFVPPMKYKTHCAVNYQGWPWGEQNCTFKLGSWTYDMNEVDIVPSVDSEHDQPLKVDMLHQTNVEVIGTSYVREEKVYSCCPGQLYPSITMSLQFRNTAKFHDNTLMTP